MPNRFPVGQRVESIRDIGRIKFGDLGRVTRDYGNGRIEVVWDNTIVPVLMMAHEIIKAAPAEADDTN